MTTHRSNLHIRIPPVLGHVQFDHFQSQLHDAFFSLTIWLLCVAITIVVPCSLIRSRISMISIEVSGSRFPVGSSAIRIPGVFTIARAIATRCCSPPDNSFGNYPYGVLGLLTLKPLYTRRLISRGDFFNYLHSICHVFVYCFML